MARPMMIEKDAPILSPQPISQSAKYLPMPSPKPSPHIPIISPKFRPNTEVSPTIMMMAPITRPESAPPDGPKHT